MNPIEVVGEIEREFSVGDLNYKGIKIWPHLRIYLGSISSSNKIKINKGQMLKMAFFSVFYGFKNFFKRYKYFFYSDSMERRKIENQYIDKSTDYLITKLGNSLDIELPLSNHYKKSLVPTEFIVSKFVFVILESIYSFLFLRKIEISNEHIIRNFIDVYKIEFDYKSSIRKFLAQYYITLFIAKIYKPKAVFFVCYYTNIGRVLAYNHSNIKTFEIQHGLINSLHLAYNSQAKLDNDYYPNYLFSFGENEKKLSNSDAFIYSNHQVFPIGNYYLDYIYKQNLKSDKINSLREAYKYIICVTGQKHYSEKLLINFLIEVTKISKNILFIFVPRDNDFEKEALLGSQIILLPEFNCYELLLMSDYHSTVYSTCAIEALSLGVRNILINIDNLSQIHYKDFLDSQTTLFANTPEEFVEKIYSFKLINKETIVNLNKSNITPGYQHNVENAIKQLFT